MELDTVPIRKLWLDRLYEEVEFSTDFWIKGSIYRGTSKPLDFCYSLCGCAEHMNDNALFKLGDTLFERFLKEVERGISFRGWNFDAFIINQLKQEDHFTFLQTYAHKFVYTELIQHSNSLKVSEVQVRFPDTYLLHIAR